MTDPVDPTLLCERRHLDASRAALARMRERTEAVNDTAWDELTSWALGRARALRLADLTIRPDTPLFFGRLFFGERSEPKQKHSGERSEPKQKHSSEEKEAEGDLLEFDAHPGEDFHIGRRHIADDSGEPLVLDWRAALSRAFYQASVRKTMGVAVRRRFGFGKRSAPNDEHSDDGVLTSFEDERLSAGDELGEASRILAAEIERPRVGPMRDIVATIQPEQDDLVRSPLAANICVQGAPGTGKTAVGLHRAAYLLYAHGEQLRRSGTLILGPNTAFMSYIEAVLPTLGEVDVTQLTVDELVAGVPVRGEDSPRAARLKHDPRMAEVLHRAVWGHVGRPDDSLMVADGGWRLRIGVEYLRKAVADARGDGVPYLVGRERVRAQVTAGLRRQVELRRGDSPSDVWVRRIGKHRTVVEFLDRVWPALDAKKLVARLLADAEFRGQACAGILDDSEQELLAGRTKTPRFTLADALLVDEVAGLLERADGFGHIVIDEAQDLSAMQCRAIARRSAHGSLTVLGDLAQGTSEWTAAGWPDSLAHLGKPEADVVELTTGFRVPADVIALANRLLPHLGVDVPAARSLRSDGMLEIVKASDLDDSVAAAVNRALEFEGSIGVIAADSAVEHLRGVVEAASEGDRVSLIPATNAKGLEFDHVVVVEPSDIVKAERMGMRRLYVVLTRAVSRLTVVHARSLPAELS
ncbi:MAG: HelD family protein [Stackebrandtia sp.]